MKTNVRVAIEEEIGIFPSAVLEGKVSFAVMLNDTGDYGDWRCPRYGEPIFASSPEDFRAQVLARFPKATFPWSLEKAGVKFPR